MGKQLQMHPLVIIMSILFFGSLFGAIGVIFASPISASIRVFVEFFKERRQMREAREAAETAVAPDDPLRRQGTHLFAV
ncbi:MAG: AI-2E family transporter [Bacillus subtilis]|nr:AI-2E family transporter [Bacillus subtilis]